MSRRAIYWLLGLGFVAVAVGWATFEQWVGLVKLLIGLPVHF